jgi:CRISPR-associated protein Cas1
MSASTKTTEIPTADSDDAAWKLRSEIWQRRSQNSANRRGKREREREPLILAGHGVSLRIDGGSLFIRNGFSYYPQKQETHRFFKGDLNLPERIIMLDGSGSISFDVLSWLNEQNVSLIHINYRGEVICIASQSGYSANPYRVQWQRETRQNHHLRMEFSVELITKKIDAATVTLEKAIRKSDAWEKAMQHAYSALTRLSENPPKNITELRVLEANAAATYFRAWRGIPIKWSGINRRPIPENWKQIGQRNSLFNLTGNRNADHPINAILNYAYTVRQSQIQINAVADGYDPSIGIMHEGKNSAAFIFDLIEPERATVDRKVLEFVKEHIFDPADFVLQSDGVCRLNPELARFIAGIAV